ncbi:outer membrane channel protein [Xanthomonas vasicola pv. vasculorum NCPPB 895]|uniref:efflux transporter outer membrane subunit n=1 Tax=Xanthomonas vasicola TaxID=56459 RepID=UPI000345B64E|nr:efflux transporter outer membrane subunit [Xanthomonas vasicola]KEZ96675.1 outer membrane channel protein [Xanthomonas vasicola pv. vasculorum NCPPB 895]MBV7306344.1 efflux transporter outer membrane subunit [Xanthomonas vasicola pv. vasculorum]MDO6935679.1 efflux transporter outer membrane subunit [Xanthomonas vasicola]MDO6939601.1 efflux transporter outer membrane subunit [Xanthomonas vasicola]
MIPQIIPRRWSCVCLIAASAVLSAGCSLTPAYQRPPVSVPATFGSPQAASAPDQPDANATAAVRLNTQERAFLQAFAPDRDLQPLVERALAHNGDFRRAALQVEQARAQYGIAQASRLPTIAVGAQQLRQHFDNPALDARYQQDLVIANAGIGNFEVDFFGKLQAMSEAARQRYLASTYGRDAARGALIAEVLRAYTTERTAAQAMQHLQSLDADSAALLAIAERQYQVGLIARDERDAQRRQADQAHVAALQGNDNHAAAVRALQLLAGYDSTPVPGDLQGLIAADTPASAWRALDSSLLLQRPDIQQAELELRAANADIGAARAAFFPSITLSTSVGTASDGLSGLFSAGHGVWSFMPQLNLPLFDGGRNRANLDLAQVRKRADVVAYEQAIESAFREVANALDAHATLSQAEPRSREQVEREQLRLARMHERMDAGLEDRSALLAKRTRTAQTELDYLDTARQRVLSRIALFQAFYGVRLPTSS